MKDYHAPLYPGNYYHIFNRGNNRENLFANDGNYIFFLEKVQKYLLVYLKIFAYCLMPNHFHFLAQVRSEPEIKENLPNIFTKPHPSNFTKLSKFSKVAEPLDANKLLEDSFQHFFISYSLAYNKQQRRTGSLFEKRFKRIHIESERYLIKLLHYVHNNPIHHRFCKEYGDWRYSSYNAIIGQQKTNVEKDAVIAWFGSVDNFIEFHQQMIDYGEIQEYLFDE